MSERTPNIAHAAWTATGGTPSYVGTCQRCGATRRATALSLQTLGFGRGDVWACDGGCATAAAEPTVKRNSAEYWRAIKALADRA